MRFKLGELLFLSRFENGRIRRPAPDPREIANFEELINPIALSLAHPQKTIVNHALTPTSANPMAKTSAGASFSSLSPGQRAFADENLLQKLLQYRSQIPVSHRIIRATRS